MLKYSLREERDEHEIDIGIVRDSFNNFQSAKNIRKCLSRRAIFRFDSTLKFFRKLRQAFLLAKTRVKLEHKYT